MQKRTPPSFISGSASLAMQILERGEGDRVEEDIEPAPLLLDCSEHGLQLTLGANVERQQDWRFQLAGKRLDIGLGPGVEVGHRKIGTEAAKGLGAAPGDRALVGNAGDQAFAASEVDLGARDHGRLLRSVRVWRAIMRSSSVGMT